MNSEHSNKFTRFNVSHKFRNKFISAKGMYIGAPCDGSCNSNLLHVYCDESTKLCGCERNYPVKIGLTKGCAKRRTY